MLEKEEKTKVDRGGQKKTRLPKNKDEEGDVDYDEDIADSGSEADDAEGTNVLEMEDLDVEEKTVEFDEEVKITPFNLDEEMEEGHFDKDGTFVFDKTADIKDSWLDEVDFNDVRQLESAKAASEKRQAKQEDEDATSGDETLTVNQIYEQIVSIILPGENILRAVRRLGNASRTLSASERMKQKKLAAKNPGAVPTPLANVEEQKKQLSRLIELADLLIRRGQMNAYEETHESLKFHLAQAQKQEAATRQKIAPTTDMFADDFTEKSAPEKSAEANQTDPKGVDDDVKWEYKTSASDDADIQGPVLTTVLMKLISPESESGPPRTLYIRRHGSGSSGQFYNSNRVDFSLYID